MHEFIRSSTKRKDLEFMNIQKANSQRAVSTALVAVNGFLKDKIM
jgi:hypothetical protein